MPNFLIETIVFIYDLYYFLIETIVFIYDLYYGGFSSLQNLLKEISIYFGEQKANHDEISAKCGVIYAQFFNWMSLIAIYPF